MPTYIAAVPVDREYDNNNITRAHTRVCVVYISRHGIPFDECIHRS